MIVRTHDVATEPELRWEDVELLDTDEEPMESRSHCNASMVLRLSIHFHLSRGGRRNFYLALDEFFWFRPRQVPEIRAEMAAGVPLPERMAFRGPDVFVVLDVDPSRPRQHWMVPQEDNRFPNIIFELTSPSTAYQDLVVKKELYEQTFKTPEYILYDPITHELTGYRLTDGKYQPIAPTAQGRIWSEQLQIYIGTWTGTWEGETGTFLRLYDPDGTLVPIESEAERDAKEAAEQRAEAERVAKEAERVAKEAAEQRAEAERAAKEAERVAKEAAEQRAEAERAAKEAERAAKETAEQRAEAERVAKEAAEQRAERLARELEQLRAQAQAKTPHRPNHA